MRVSPVIAITATRQSGKDTLCRRLRSLNRNITRGAFADKLKQDLRPLIYQQFGFDIMSCTNEQKELVRDILISYGMAWRAVEPLHWVNELIDHVEMARTSNPAMIPCICDVRFENETQHLRDTYGTSFVLINLTREGSPPPTDEEEKHFREVAAMADFHLHWGHNTKEEQLVHARRILKWVGLEKDL